jgi:predicted O-methyltransferase YrrM
VDYLWIGSLLIGLASFISIVWNSWKYGITPTPTGYKVQCLILEICPLIPSGKIAELGSGWGILALALANHYPDQQVIGYEISPIPYVFSRCLKLFVHSPFLQLKRKNFFYVSLKEFDLIICYLYPGAMHQLKTKFEKELRPGTIIISHTFAVPGWTPSHFYKVDDLYQTPIYVYKIN